MAYILYYRKPEHHEGFPWHQACQDIHEADEFIKKLGDKYEFRVFEEIDFDDFMEIIEETKEINK